MLRIALALALFACGHTSSPQPAPAPPPQPEPSQPAPPADPPAPAQSAPSFGEKCGANDACAPGLECVSYYGIAGAKGPQFKTCEQRCDNAKACPADKQCRTVADGPGRVCR
jgi:hypothetical protein